MLVQTFHLIEISAPSMILPEPTSPLALAEDFEVRSVRRLQGSRHVDPIAVALVGTSRGIGSTSANRIVRGGNAVLEEAVQLVQLAVGNADGILQDTPVIGIRAVVGTCDCFERWKVRRIT